MAEEVGYSENFYAGADYGLDPDYAGDLSTGIFPNYRFPASSLGVATDPRTANQLKAVSDKLNTGAKNIEVSGVTAATLETIPEQHLKEIERLKKLTGVNLTFHGPTIEPTGVSRQGWNESHREQAERQMWQSVERAHRLDSKGNIVVTFHSSNGLPDPETKVMEEVIDPETGKKKMKERIKEFWFVSNDGQFQSKTISPDYFKSKEGEYETFDQQKNAIQTVIDKQNKDVWYRQLQQLSFHANNGAGIIEKVLSGKDLDSGVKQKASENQWLKIYSDYSKGKPVMKVVEKIFGEQDKEVVGKQLQEFEHGDLYLRDAYQDLQNLFNQAYDTAKKGEDKETLKKLNDYRQGIKNSLIKIEDPMKLQEFGSEIIEGVHVLRSIEAPESLKPLRKFAVDKSSETFSNVAFNAYKKFKDTAPIISVENPPVGMGLSRADDLRDVVKASREKLQKKLVEKEGLSEFEAEEQAKKLIGVTWDVGHINMVKKYVYDDKLLEKETKTVAPFVKHVHLSDNFGMEHTELPMGMGNVPTKKMLEIIQKYGKQVEKIKHIAETGTWFGPQAFGTRTPFAETLKSFGSPIYSMKMAPYWNQAYASSGGYFAGYGQTLPEQHFSMYGAGFSGLPPELGGQVARGGSRLGGTPME
ncbi:MAG: hypothetical protein KKF39_04025 [Nanoarchaeota archaeon]|nr:hypothetical protein [Nanoarchaeota archaeon]